VDEIGLLRCGEPGEDAQVGKLTGEQVEGFIRDGFVYLPGAFPRSLADECRAFLWRETGLDADDPAGWTRPVIRLGGYGGPLFRAAANTEALTSAFDALVGVGRWFPRDGLGTFPIRFPHPDDPGDAGWHMESSFAAEGGEKWLLNVHSRERALLMLFLFSDIGPDDAPTRIKIGSHLDVPPFLLPHGHSGVNMFELCRTMDAAGKLDSPDRPVTLATGQPGDVYLCHPFLIHGAQPHRGAVPRFMAQPPLLPAVPFDVSGGQSPVERAIRLGLTENVGP
jgi:Phytanoyl-CoA dioxygenase (PhyH)